MSINELSSFICNEAQSCDVCVYEEGSAECKLNSCVDGTIQWLNKEAGDSE